MTQNTIIPVMRPKLPNLDQIRPHIEEINSTRIYSNSGPILNKLREEYAKYLDVPIENIVPVANATQALQGALEILTQQNWIVPDYTFAATAHAAISANKSIKLSDVSKDNFQLLLPPSLDRSNFGALPGLPFCAPVDFEPWLGFDSLVIDAAASLGATPPNFNKMPHNSIVVYSLHATKVLGAGEGALVICENSKIAKKMRAWSNFGFESSRISNILGTNAKMSEYSAAVAVASILDFENERDEWLASLSKIANTYIPERYRTIVDRYPGFRPYWIIQTSDLNEKKSLEKYLLDRGVETRSWWGARISDMPAFSKVEKLMETSTAKDLVETHLGLPIWRGITSMEVKKIGEIICNFELQ